MIFVVSRAGYLLRRVADLLRREKLALLDIDHAPRAARGYQQVGLARKKRRDLQHVADFSDRPHLRNLMDIGEDRKHPFAS